MEYILLENEKGKALICFDEDFTSIDYEYYPDAEGHLVDGNFLFEIDDVKRVFELDNEDVIVNFLKGKVSQCHDAKEAWSLLLQLFDENDIECDVDEREGFMGNDGFMMSNF